jgi:serine/threonine-protein kinase
VLHEGDQIAERYRLTTRIAVGGMGEVWESRDLRLNRTVAIKVLKPEIGSDPDFLDRFRTEAQIAASLNHRGIAGVHDYGEGITPDGTPTAYLVMELVHGEPLSARLASRGKLSAAATLDLMEQTGRGLYAAHSRGFVHRDVKPGNILIALDGTVKLTDFGIAKAATAAPVTESGMVMGTAHYIAPEQAKGEVATPASDVYSLGVVGYECLVGHRPFLATSPVEVAMMHIHDQVPPLPDSIPETVRRLIETALAKNPQQRYANGGEFSAAVALVRNGQPPPLPGIVVVQSTSGALPAVGTLPQDRESDGDDGPDEDGLATEVPEPMAQAPAAEVVSGVTGSGGAASGGTGSAGTGSAGAGSGQPAPSHTVSASNPSELRVTGSLRTRGTWPGGVAASGEQRAQRQFTPPSPSKGGRAAMMTAFVALTLAAVAIGIYVVHGAVNSDTVGPGASTVPVPSQQFDPTGTAPGQAMVDPAGLTGKAADAAAVELTNSGLVPSVITTTGGPAPRPAACTVTGLAPAGTLARGTAVTITCIQH